MREFYTIEWPPKERYIGCPINAAGVTRSPFDDLSLVMGANNPDPILKALADRVRTIHQKLLALSIISRTKVRTALREIAELADTEAHSRLGNEGMHLIMNANGDELYRGVLLFPHQYEHMGSYDPATIEALENKRLALPKATTEHLATGLGLIQIPLGSTIVEMGAGANYQRIRALEGIAKAAEGRLVCQDILPAYAHAAANEVAAPYLPIPGFASVLSEAFGDVPSPRVVTMKDVITVMSASELEELIRFLTQINPECLLISQSLNVSEASTIIPRELTRGNEDFLAALTLEVLNDPILKAYASNDMVMSALNFEILHALPNIFLELIRRKLLTRLRANTKLKNTKTTLVEQEEVLEGDDINLILNFLGSNYATLFAEGFFNTLKIGPFIVDIGSDTQVPRSKLKVVSTEVHLAFAENKNHLHTHPKKTGQKTIEISDNGILAERGLTFSSESQKALYRKNIDEQRPLVLPPSLNLAQVAKMARRIAIKFVFNRTANIQLVDETAPAFQRMIAQAFTK